MGGFDLYGNYYQRSIDAENAEMAQCAAIDADIARRHQRELEDRISDLEREIEQLRAAKEAHNGE